MVEFKKEQFGAIVAQIFDGPNGMIEVQKLPHERYGLTLHVPRKDGAYWDDMTVEIGSQELLALGSLAFK